MRLSLRIRFLVVLILLMLGIFAAITFLIISRESKTLRGNLVTESKSFAALATQPIGSTFVTYKDSGTIKISQEISSFTDLDSDINQVAIIDTNGKQLFSNQSDMAQAVKVSSDQASALTPTYFHDQQGRVVTIVQPYLETFGQHRYNVVYGISYASINKDIHDIVTSILTLSAAILLISLAIWYLLINRLFLKPIAYVSRMALVISKGNLDQQTHLDRGDEIGDLSRAVDTMADSLKADIAKLKKTDQIKSEFLMITAHNLRTPLSIISGNLDNLTVLFPDEKVQKAVDPINTNVERLRQFAEDALTISTMEGGQMVVERKSTEMKPVLERLAEEFKKLAEQKKQQFVADINTEAWVELNQVYFHSALWNLLDNAHKFTAEGGTVELHAATVDQTLQIQVKDTGIGIDEAEIPQLFTKFHRATDTLVYNYEGTGIGLYLSKLIIEQLGGTITVESIKDKGSTFTIKLPTIVAPVEKQKS